MSETPIERLHTTTDGQQWARRFIETIHKLPKITELDEGLMVAWFANAIETGKSHGRAETLSEFDANVNALVRYIHAGNVAAGWWSNLETGERKERNVGELLMLTVSELAEAMEGHRKNLMDDKLPHRKMFEVELADTVIRIFDMAGGLGFGDLGGAIMEKLAFNAQREDHKIEARKKADGKKY